MRLPEVAHAALRQVLPGAGVAVDAQHIGRILDPEGLQEEPRRAPAAAIEVHGPILALGRTSGW
ncbi:hypothetical protein GCM10009793_15390 [Brachybacterium phenoliresistens]